VQRKEQLERLIRSLVESINGTIRRSGQIRDIMKEIEHHGYEIHLSLLAGIVLRDREEEDDDLTDIFSDEDSFETEEFEGYDEDDEDEDEDDEETLDLSEEEEFTDEDLRFLISLGLTPD
jgi:hypothetical protein